MSRDTSPATFIHYFPSLGENTEQVQQADSSSEVGGRETWTTVGAGSKKKIGSVQRRGHEDVVNGDGLVPSSVRQNGSGEYLNPP